MYHCITVTTEHLLQRQKCFEAMASMQLSAIERRFLKADSLNSIKEMLQSATMKHSPYATRPRCMINVYTVCHCVCVFWKHYSGVQPHCSNFRITTAIFSSVQIFRILWNTVNLYIFVATVKILKIRNPKNCANHPKIRTVLFSYRVIGTKDADRMANSVDPDQTAPLGAVWSGSTLFA